MVFVKAPKYTKIFKSIMLVFYLTDDVTVYIVYIEYVVVMIVSQSVFQFACYVTS